jgi:hypothetical protein
MPAQKAIGSKNNKTERNKRLGENLLYGLGTMINAPDKDGDMTSNDLCHHENMTHELQMQEKVLF